MMSESSSQPSESASPAFVEQADHGGYYIYHEWDEQELSVTIILAVAEIADVAPTRVADAFPYALDTDALDNLFTPWHGDGGDSRHNGHLEFLLAGYTVTVYSSGLILIE